MSSWDEPPIIYYRNTFQPVNTISRQLPTIPSRTVNPTIGTQLLLKIILPSIVVISIIATVTIIVCVLLKISQNTTQDQITTTGLYTTTEPNQTLVLRRRSIEVVGAPSAMVYVDSHQMAGSHGNVTRVSFYADHTCALNFVEFAAFDLIHRDVDLNTAELIVTHRSGPLQLGTPNELKPYMTLITIQLCSEKLMQNINSGVCQGNQFPVLPHHYIGVRSDKCRLGFVQPSLNLVFGTTWTQSDRSDPFNEPYQILNYVPANYTILQSITIDSFEKNNIQRTDPKDIRSTQLRVLFIGTYPPRQCGLAKYLEDLIDNYKGSYSIVAIDEKDLKSTDRNYSNNVVFRLKQNDREIYYKVAEMANSQGYDVVNIQHEYGLYGGMCGEYIVHLLASVRKPIIITMHTVLPKPTEFYLSLTRTIAALSTRIIVLSPVGRRLLVDLYGVDETKISIVHHGVPDVPFSQTLTEEKQRLGFDAKRPIMATFGLIHRDKNIQLVLKAMKNIIEYVPNILYLVLGQTHPLIKLHEGKTHSDRSDPFNKPYQILNYVPVNYTILQSITIDSFEKNNIQRTDPKDIRSTQLRVLFIGTYPPRQCGLAKYLEDLIDNYKGSYGIVAIDEKDLKSTDRNYSNNVVFRLKQNEREIYYKVAEMANSQGYDVVNIQHEYGLYGGMCGEYIVHLLASVRKPIIITMHTVLPKPTEFYLSLTRTIAALSTRIIVLSPVGRRLLVDLYGVDETKISIVHHGVPDVPFSQILTEEKQKLGFDAKRPIMATFGLLHRDKNIQLVLKAMKNIIEYVPNILYLVLGQTHPLIKLHEGDSYRHELENNVTTLSLVNNVYFVNKYLDDKELISYLSASDIYITPYIHEEQYVSGTLAWAVGLGKAVVSTPYLYAKELLAHGRGFLIPFNGHQALSSTIITLVQNQEIRDAARRKAYKFGRQMIWPSVTCDYENIFRDALLYF
ncbi:unnamed protein product [Rotaria sp. Silwood1]|nr:unnamed protein product [Rotaria sp. Silwood1]